MKAPKLTASWVVFALVAGLLVAGVAVASAHGGGPKRQVIHACVDDQTGAIEIINASGHCGAGESPLDWNGKGPAGSQGPPGPPGETGFANVTVVTATNSNFTVGPNAPNVNGISVGVGVDCPGDATATGGGASTSVNSNTLYSSFPLEGNTSTNNYNPAETGDTPTGWYAQGSPPVTVYAVCAAVGPSPSPGDEDD
ncbi:MAG TPA: hypothetical protein VFK59_04930 [Actinomycetota bacterium]|jgi:hypothetical protein|nr:hypothetical protein [Actinomycetota bacterium]